MMADNSQLYDRYYVVVAAGSGSRFGSSMPKQFCDMHSRPVLMHTIDSIRRADPSGRIVLVLSESMVDFWQDLCRKHDFSSPLIVHGGATRFHSVKNALNEVKRQVGSGDASKALVFVHDGARPLVRPEVVQRLTDAGCESGCIGAVPVVELTDSIRAYSTDRLSSQAVDRSNYCAVQTPQVFRLDILTQAYDCEFRPDFTDDASVVEVATGRMVATVEGSPATIKITRPYDIAIAEVIADRLS